MDTKDVAIHQLKKSQFHYCHDLITLLTAAKGR